MGADPRLLGRDFYVVAGVFLVLCVLSRIFGYLSFHVIAEFFTIIISFFVFFMIVIHRNAGLSTFLLFVGSAYFTVGLLDIFHTLSYKGMGVFNVNEINVATQFWISARLAESSAYALGALFSSFVVPLFIPMAGYLVFGALVSYLILYTGMFPDALLADTGLTGFKIYTEYIIISLLLFTMISLYRLRTNFSSRLHLLFILAISTSVISEFFFTLYNDVYGVMNMLGHVTKGISFYFILNATVASIKGEE